MGSCQTAWSATLTRTLDFLKVLRFSFPVPVVGPSALSLAFSPPKTKKFCASRLALVKKMSSTCLPSHQLLKASGPRKHPVQDACEIVCPVFFIHFHKKHKTQKTKLCPVQAARTQSCVLRESCDKPLKMFASIRLRAVSLFLQI